MPPQFQSTHSASSFPFHSILVPLVRATCLASAAVCAIAQDAPVAGESQESREKVSRPSYYSDTYCASIDKQAITQDVQDVLGRMNRERPVIADFVQRAKDARHLCFEAFEKRTLILDRQSQYVKALLTSPSPDALLYARQGSYEILALLNYFTKESALFDQSAPGSEIRISVKDFGAVGDGLIDDAPAIRKAIEWAKTSGKKATIFLPKGHYLLSDVAENAEWPTDMSESLKLLSWNLWRNVHLPILNLKHCVIEGEEGTLLLCDKPTRTAISVIGCEDVVVRNLSIDYVNLPFTQGVIRSIDQKSKTIIWEKENEYPSPDLENFLGAAERRGLPYTASDKKVNWAGGDKFLGAVEKQEDGSFRIEIARGGMVALTPGVKFAIIGRHDGTGSAINVRGSDFCTFVNVAVYSAPGVAFMAGRSSAMSLIDCRIEPLPGSNRLISTNGDGFQFVNGLVGPYMKGCAFRGMHDDGFMISTRSMPVREVAADGLSLKTTPSLFRKGDRIAVISQEGGTIQAEADIVSMNESASGAELRFASPLPRIETMNGLGMKELNHKEMHEYYTGGKQFKQFPGLVMDLDFSCGGTVLLDNDFRDHRGTGIKIQTPNAIVQGNHVSGVQSVGISLSSLLQWRETFAPRNIVVADNSVADVSVGLAVFYALSAQRNSDARPIRHILIQRNRIENPLRAFLYLNNSEDIVMKDNTFSSPVERDVSLVNVTNVEVDGNFFRFPNASAEGILQNALSKDTIHLSNNHFGDLPSAK